MLNTIWEWLKANLLTSLMGFLAFVYVIAWALNALVGTKFDLPQLLELAKFALGKIGIDSVFNTQLGSKLPKESINENRNPV